jgi:hypothetical protein
MNIWLPPMAIFFSGMLINFNYKLIGFSTDFNEILHEKDVVMSLYLFYTKII